MINIATYNIAGISLPEKKQIMLNFFLQHQLDIVCLQEITFNHCPILTQHYNMHTNLGPRKHGTAVLVRHGLRVKNAQLEPEGRLLSLEVQGITFVCIYAPSGDGNKLARDHFFRITVPAYCTTYNTPFVLLGDFNAVEELSDRKSTKNNQPKVRPSDIIALRELTTSFELTDVWRAIRKSEPGWTFTRPSGQARLDRIYTRNTIKFSDILTHTLPFSDHSALVAVIQTSASIRRAPFRPNGLWKLNTSILIEESYQDLV